MKAVVAAFNQEKALVGAFSVLTNLRMEIFQALAANRGQIYVASESLDFNFLISLMNINVSAGWVLGVVWGPICCPAQHTPY